MTTTARLELPLIEPGQAQKEMFHNEALATIDIALHASVLDIGIDVPPAQPAAGASWVVGAAPTGAWAGHAHALASWTAGGWRFVPAREGLVTWNLRDAVPVRFVEGRWESGSLRGTAVRVGGEQVVGARRPAIPDAAGGIVVDIEGRAALGQVLAVLRGHGLIAG